jgi:hypothetical protein
MGRQLIDQYSLLHAAVGVVMYFFKFSLMEWTIIHILFEILENTEYGMHTINHNFKGVWPGGKNFADSFVNSTGDIIAGNIGWFIAKVVDDMFKNRVVVDSKPS